MNFFQNWGKSIQQLSYLIFGSMCMAISMDLFAIPRQLGEGGVPGLSMLAYYALGIAPGVSVFVLNSAILLFALKSVEKETLSYTLIVVILNSLFLSLLKNLPLVQVPQLMSAIFAGGTMGLGISLIYSGGGTAASGTLIAEILHTQRGWKRSQTILLTDISIILPSYFVIGGKNLMLTLISVYTCSKVISFSLEKNRKKEF